MKTKDKIIEIINKYGDFSIYKAQENILNAIADEILIALQGEQDDEPPKHPTSWRDFTMTDKEPKVGVKERQSAEEYPYPTQSKEDILDRNYQCSTSGRKRLLKAMQEYAEQYHKEQTREELKNIITFAWKYVNENGWTTVDIVIDEYLKNK